MSFRYGYTATMKGKATEDEDGYPIAGADISFVCDYQPTPMLNIKDGGDFINIKYKLFVPPSCDVEFIRGAEITCAGVKGTIVEPYVTYFNTEIWVK